MRVILAAMHLSRSVWLLAAVACQPSPLDPDAALSSGDISQVPLGDPEHYWLRAAGDGPEHTEAVCARGAEDPVIAALCAPERPQLDGLTALRLALDLPGDAFRTAVAVASSGLSARQTSVFKPRVITMTATDFSEEGVPVAAAAFSRGDLTVELAAYDKVAGELNFYLLSYVPACGDNCDPATLFSAAVEEQWQGWTLYDERDLQDTPLDCAVCHQPGGPDTPKRFLMRDTQLPWVHWMAISGFLFCANGVDGVPSPSPSLRTRVRQTFPEGYGAVGTALMESVAGHNLHSMIGQFSLEYRDDRLDDEPFPMPSSSVYQEWQCDRTTESWETYRDELLFTHGLPTPSYHLDVTDYQGVDFSPEALREFLQQRSDEDAFEIANGFINREIQAETGAIAPDDWDAPTILTAMCSRCHNDRAPEGSVRARFHVDKISAEAAAKALTRIQLPSNSPHAMPPRTAGELSPGAKATLEAHLRQLKP